MSETSSAESQSRDRILAVATELFARHGYDATSARQIADAAGLNVATVAYHTGSKSDLYREVMRAANEAEASAVGAALADFARQAPAEPGKAAVALADGYLDFCIAHPDVTALWMRRWMEDAEQFPGLEEEYSRPLIEQVRDVVSDALPAVTPDRAELAIWTVLWTTQGFCRSMIREQVPRFRAYLHELVLRELGLGVNA